MLLMAALPTIACGDANDHEAMHADAAAPSGRGGAGSATLMPDAHARKLATSPSHTCALRKTGLFCWGANEKGQLGDETSQSASVPVHAKVAGDDVVEVALHTGRSCVRKQSGKVACWGANDSGQLGDGTQTDSLEAVEPDVADVKQLALDEKSTCVLRADQSVWCWGGPTAPAAVGGIEGALDVHNGGMNAYCARVKDGAPKCWHMQDGAWTTPTEASALLDASAIALAGPQVACGIVSSGEVVCQDLASGKSATLQGSRGTSALEGGLLTLCGGDNAGAWFSWNILSPALLQTIPAQRRELSRGPFFEFSTAAYRYCGLEAGGQVQCMESNATSPAFSPVADLPE
jgi:hypothetical protein